jgi:hypothetical protein
MSTAPTAPVATMTELSFPAQVHVALTALERLQADPVTRRDAYSPQDLRNIIRMWSER